MLMMVVTRLMVNRCEACRNWDPVNENILQQVESPPCSGVPLVINEEEFSLCTCIHRICSRFSLIRQPCL